MRVFFSSSDTLQSRLIERHRDRPAIQSLWVRRGKLAAFVFPLQSQGHDDIHLARRIRTLRRCTQESLSSVTNWTGICRRAQTKEHEMRCLSKGCCQCQRILKLLTLRVIMADGARLHSPLMTAWQSPVHHVCTQTNARNLAVSWSNWWERACAHARTRGLSSVCHYLLPSVIMLMWLH